MPLLQEVRNQWPHDLAGLIVLQAELRGSSVLSNRGATNVPTCTNLSPGYPSSVRLSSAAIGVSVALQQVLNRLAQVVVGLSPLRRT